MNSDINEEINLANYITQHTEPFQYSYQCHEGMLTFAYAINKTIEGKRVRYIKIHTAMYIYSAQHLRNYSYISTHITVSFDFVI